MKRYLFCLTLLAVLALPDWASAFYRRWYPPPQYYSASPPPRLFYRTPPVMIAPSVPVYGVPICPPPVVWAVPIAPPAVAPPMIAPSTAVPRPAPAPMPPSVVADPRVEPAGAADTRTEPRGPKPGAGVESILPLPARVPDPPAKASEKAAKVEPLVLPPLEKESRPKPVPTATPTPAPPPSEVEPAFSLPKLPGIPAVPETKKAGSNDSLPPLVLPPESAGGPSGVVPESTSRSSPLSAGVRVQVFIATGSLTAATTRRIGFFNHTNRDLDLVIEGRPVTLPRKSYIHAEVPATFSWRHSDNPAQPTTVPAGSPGLDVLFRE